MSAELRKRLEDEARGVGRSLNAEIIARLEASFSEEAGLSDVDKKFLLLLVKELKAKNQMDLFPGEGGEAAQQDPTAEVPKPRRIVRPASKKATEK